jgi:hypothetical protein
MPSGPLAGEQPSATPSAAALAAALRRLFRLDLEAIMFGPP